MVIDCHTHIRFEPSTDTFFRIPELIESMERTGVDKACVIYSPARAQHLFWREEDIAAMAEAVANVIPKYSERFFSLLWLNPALPSEFNIKLVERYMVNGSIDGVKLSIQMNARDERLEPLAAYLQEHDIPVLFHSWYKTVNKYRYESDPSDIVDLACRFPELRILMAHLTGCKKRGVQDIKKYENIFIDTSGSQPEDGYLEYAIDELGADRIVFGSDFPGRDIGTQLGRIYSVDMDDEMRNKILYKNAESFFTKGGRAK